MISGLMMNIIKYGLFGIILVVFAVKVWQETQKIVKKFKGKDDDFKLDIEDIGG